MTKADIDWYERSDDLREEQVFEMHDGSRAKLDRRVPGDGTAWYVADWWNGSWAYMDSRIHPADLKTLLET